MSNLNDFGEEVVPMRGTAVAPFARALQSTRRWDRRTKPRDTSLSMRPRQRVENFLRYLVPSIITLKVN